MERTFIISKGDSGSDDMPWRQFVMDLESLNPDRVEEILSRHGAHAVTLSGAGEDEVLEPGPGQTPLWRESRISGLFSAAADLDSLKDDLLHSLGLRTLPQHSIVDLADRAWEREWLKDFRPMRFGHRLWVSPRAFEVDAASAVVVRLDPGLAFGTGSHPSTALCLRWLDAQDIAGKRVLDYGCGSGILAIAALLLGAGSACALDTDPQAIIATTGNARENGVDDRLFVTQDVAQLPSGFDIVVANILAEPLVRHARWISEQVITGGSLALSGILAEQAGFVTDAYRDWIEFGAPAIDRTTEQSWVCLAGKRI